MVSVAIPITTNNFILQPSGKYKVSLPASSVAGWVSSTDYGTIRCYRNAGMVQRQVLFYNEIDSDGNLIFLFDEPFEGKVVLSADSY